MKGNTMMFSTLLILLLMVIFSSCSSSETYADRKRSKYSNSNNQTRRSKQISTHSEINSPKDAVLLRNSIVATAKEQIGRKYIYGGKNPKGFDCSGFTTYVFDKNGISLADSSKKQAKQGKKRSKSKIQRGDLLFFGKGKVSHVAIVADVGPRLLKVIHSTSSRGVVMEDISSSKYWQGRYLYGRDIVSSHD